MVHALKPEMPAPPKSSILGVSKNKIQLNRMLANALLGLQFYIPATQEGYSPTLAGLDNVPFRLQNSVKTELRNLSPNHEEPAIAGYIHQENVRVVSDDTDVFVLLLHFYATNKGTSAQYMSSTKSR